VRAQSSRVICGVIDDIISDKAQICAFVSRVDTREDAVGGTRAIISLRAPDDVVVDIPVACLTSCQTYPDTGTLDVLNDVAMKVHPGSGYFGIPKLSMAGRRGNVLLNVTVLDNKGCRPRYLEEIAPGIMEVGVIDDEVIATATAPYLLFRIGTIVRVPSALYLEIAESPVWGTMLAVVVVQSNIEIAVLPQRSSDLQAAVRS